MGKLEDGPMKLLNGNLYMGAKSKYPTIEDFVEDAVTKYDLLYDSEYSHQEIIDMIHHHVFSGYIVQRAYMCGGDWWEYSSFPRRGMAPAWGFYLDALKDPGRSKLNYDK